MAFPTIGARIVSAIIHVSLTVDSLEPLLTLTQVFSNSIHTRGTILTWCRLTFVNIYFAIASLVTTVTRTVVGVAYIMAGAPILAQLRD